MVTLTTADSALKSVYLGVLSNQLNINSNPLLGKIKQTTQDVWGKEIIKLAPFGINGGIGSGNENSELPKAYGNNYVQFKSTLKNLYGVIEISDKAIRASQNSAGAFVNLLNNEMENLIKSSSYHLSRMLYGDGKGILALCQANTSGIDVLSVQDTKNLIEGMGISFVTEGGMNTAGNMPKQIMSVDRVNNTIRVNSVMTGQTLVTTRIVLQNSYNSEITGLGAIFDPTTTSLYGVEKANCSWLNPYVKATAGDINESLIQTTLDNLEERGNDGVDIISTTYALRRGFQTYMGTYRRIIDTMELAGGYKALSYNGIPVVADRFVSNGEVYLLNSKDFTMHQLCDWQWLEGDDGRIIRQKPNYAAYSATLVKYANLLCDKPCAQAKLTGVTVAI